MSVKVYLAGQPNEYDNKWKDAFKATRCLKCYDWEIDSDQSSSDTFFPDDLKGVKAADYMIANPGISPSEATWIEVGYFYANNVKKSGDFCDKLIIVWKENRNPKWSIEFVKKAGFVVTSTKEAKKKLLEQISKKA